MHRNVDIAVVGGGPAGLAAALEARKHSPEASILIIERDRSLGGILQQCIHNGFGLHFFGEELTGPEYAGRFIAQLEGTGIEVLTDTMVLDLSDNRVLTAVSAENGLMHIEAKAVVLAMGCRERTRGALNIPGTRPAGVYTAGCGAAPGEHGGPDAGQARGHTGLGRHRPDHGAPHDLGGREGRAGGRAHALSPAA